MTGNNISKLSDIQLITNIKNNSCDSSINELIKRHINIVNSVIHKFYKRNPHSNLMDLMDDKNIIFINAVNSFNVEKGAKFPTWLYNCSRYYCLNTNKNLNKTINFELNEIEKINLVNNKFYMVNDKMVENSDYIFNILGQMKDKRIKEIFQLRYFNGKGDKPKPWKDVSKKINLSITRTLLLHKQGRDLIFKKINSQEKMDSI